MNRLNFCQLNAIFMTHQFFFFASSFSNFIRGKSVSTEDLTAERNELNFDDDVEPSEWKRVSKIRRSLQFPRSSIQK
jgi:hypothetical protein